jgi:hypothetical protein
MRREGSYFPDSKKLVCNDCGKEFGAGMGHNGSGPWIAPGGWMPRPNPSAGKLPWQTTAVDEFHRYVVIHDGLYGRRWILQVDLFKSDYWLVLGAFWTMGSARFAAEQFRDSWREWLVDSEGVSRWRLPKRIVDLARAKATTQGRAVSDNCPNCGERVYNPAECRVCGHRLCEECRQAYILEPSRWEETDVCPTCAAEEDQDPE